MVQPTGSNLAPIRRCPFLTLAPICRCLFSTLAWTRRLFTMVQWGSRQMFHSLQMSGARTWDSRSRFTLTAGGATVCLDKAGNATFDSPTGIKFVVGGSSLSILPGGIAIASPAVTAAAGAGSTVAMREEAVAMKSRTVTIEADGVCSVRGKSALKLQEADPVKGKKPKGQSPAAGESQGGAGAGGKSTTPVQKRDKVDGDSIEIEFVDEDGHPVDVAFHLELPDGGIMDGQPTEDGMLSATGFKPGTCKLTLPTMDAARWKLG